MLRLLALIRRIKFCFGVEGCLANRGLWALKIAMLGSLELCLFKSLEFGNYRILSWSFTRLCLWFVHVQ